MPRNWVGRHRPTRPTRVADRRQQFHMKGNRLRHAVHREIAKDVPALRSGSLDAPAPERHLRKSLDVEEFRTAQMVVAFFDARINAAHVYLSRNRGVLRMLAVDFDLTAEPCEFSMSRAQELMDTKANG